MNFIEIEDFVFSKQEIKFINFTFTATKRPTSRPTNRPIREISREIFEEAMKNLEQGTPLKSTLNGTLGQGKISVVFKSGDHLVIDKSPVRSKYFQDLKQAILAQLND
jgi:hypothetical protein